MDKRRKTVRVVCLILAAVLLLSLISGALLMMANAASSAEIKKQLEALRSEQSEIQAHSKELEQNIANNKKKTQTLVEQKADLDHQMELSRQSIENLNEQIRQYSLLIANKQEELEASLQKEQQLSAQYKTRLRSMEENGTVSYWSILFQARSFADLLDRVDMIREVSESDQLMMKKLADATKQVEKEKNELQQELEQLEKTEQELADKQTEMEAQRAESNKLIRQMQDEYAILSEEYQTAEKAESKLNEKIKKAETEYFNALSKEEAARIAELNRINNNKVSSNAPGATATGGFMFPLASSNGVTCAFGPRIHPIYGYQSNHTGVDLGSSDGVAIYATKSGTVTSATYGEANGYYVTINHGDGFSSLYAHMTNYIVGAGDYVTQGQTIGYVGTSGWSTGPHLHFEILYNGVNVNPMNYIPG